MSLRSSPVKKAERAAEMSLLFFLVVQQSRHYARMASFIKRFKSPVTAISKPNSNLFSNYFLGGFLSIPLRIGK